MRLSDLEKEGITDCKICGRNNTPGKGGWCITCFSLWYDGGEKYRDPELVRAVSLLNREGCFSPKCAEELVQEMNAEDIIKLVSQHKDSRDLKEE